jgi:hypothetical protein
MARRKKRNKGTIHPVLRAAYGNRARNLKDTILSLLLPPPDSCQCGCTGCLRCHGADYLLCQGDPTTYLHVMNYGQCAVSSNAPAPPDIYSVRQLPQRQVIIVVFFVLVFSRYYLFSVCFFRLCLGFSSPFSLMYNFCKFFFSLNVLF